MRFSTRFAAAATLFVGLACASPDPSPKPAFTKVNSGDLCTHGVESSICAHCNPSLIAVFRAKKDFCEEHGQMLSLCPVHHPERGGRPPQDTRVDNAPAHGTKIRFKTRDTADLIGLEVQPALVAEDQGGLLAPATLSWEASRHAVVHAEADGRMRSLSVSPGVRVRARDPLAAIDSASVAQDRSAMDAARAQVRKAEAALDRKRMVPQATSKAAFDEAEADLSRALAELAAVEADLRMVGPGGSNGYTVLSPLEGEVIAAHATIGESVYRGNPLFEIADPRQLRLEIAVPEREAPTIQPGMPVFFTQEGDSEVYTSRIDALSPTIDPLTRTVTARATLDNSEGRLRANGYGTARVTLPGRTLVAVPLAAVQSADQVDLVFVKLAIDEYETRRVTIIRKDEDTAYLSTGIQPNESVVTQGSFLLKTETLKDSIGAGCCDVE